VEKSVEVRLLSGTLLEKAQVVKWQTRILEEDIRKVGGSSPLLGTMAL
jgi:hypothetical protein